MNAQKVLSDTNKNDLDLSQNSFEPSQLTVKSNEVFFIGVSLLLSLSTQVHERKDRSANLPTALLCLFFLNGYPSRPYIGVGGESPIHLLIGQGAANIPSQYQSAILNDLLPCFLPAFGNHLKHSLENVLHSYSVNSLLHILQQSVKYYATSAAKLNISFILSLFNGVFGLFSNTSIIRCA